MDKAKGLNKQEVASVAADLEHKQSAKRRSAAKKIGKFLIVELGNSLFEAYLIEREDKRTWETQAEMIKALGRIRYKKLLPYVTEIIKNNIELDAITMDAATAFVRLKMKTAQDVSPIYQLFGTGKHSVLCGAVNALSYDKVIPKKEDMHRLIKIVNESVHLRNSGVMDTREVLISAMTNWPEEVVAKHLEEYKKTRSISRDMINDALKGKTYYKEY